MRVAYLNISDSSEECPPGLNCTNLEMLDLVKDRVQTVVVISQLSLQNSTIPSFIGNYHFCESGNPGTSGNIEHFKFYIAEPLWDGKGCGPFEQICCQAPGLPWFYKVFNSTTTDYLEMRVCGN